MSLHKRTFIFSQKPLDNEDIASIATAMNIQDITDFIHPSHNITVKETLDNFNNFDDFDDVVFADQVTQGLFNLTKVLDSFLECLTDFTSPETKLSDDAMAYFMFE